MGTTHFVGSSNPHYTFWKNLKTNTNKTQNKLIAFQIKLDAPTPEIKCQSFDKDTEIVNRNDNG